MHDGGSSRGDKESLDGEDDATVVEGQVVEPVQQGFRPYGTAGDEFVAISWRSGPYPDPEDLAKYEAILPGFTDRILTLTERETDHRIASERRRDDATISLASRGQVLAFIVVVTLVGGGIASILTGHSLVGFAGLIVAAATLAGAFIAPKVFSPVSDEPARPGAAIEPGTQQGGSDDTKDATP